MKTAMSAVMKETGLAPKDVQNKRGDSPFENPNPIIRAKGLDYLYDHVEKDGHYISVMNTRVAALIRSGWKIAPAYDIGKSGKLEISDQDLVMAQFVQDALDRMTGSFEADITAMMRHISRGYSLSEINYKFLDKGKFKGYVGLASIRNKDQRYYSFKRDDFGHFTLRQTDPIKQDLDINKFVHFINGFDDENPYGESMAAVCAFWVWLKENGAKFWSIYEERFGQPFVKLKVPANATEAELKKAEMIISEVHEATGMLIPDNMVLEYLEAMRTGDSNYRGFLDFSNTEISKAIIGSTLVVETNKGGSGSHALGSVHENVMSINFAYDIITSASAINQQLIRTLIDYNFKDAERYPRFQWNAVASPQFISFAQGIEAMLRSGVKIPTAWVHEITGIPIAANGEEVLEPIAPLYPGASVETGIDNRAKNKDHAPVEHFASTNRIARQQVDLNESIIYRGTRELISRYERLAKRIATERKIDAQMLAEFEEKELSGIYSQFLLISALRGYMSARNEIQPMAYSDVETSDYYTYFYKPFDEMINEFKRKRTVPKADYERLEEAAKRMAFTVARQDSVRIMSKIQKDLEAVIRGADDLPGFYQKVVDLFESAGFMGKGNHIETVLRTNLQTQYTDSRMKVFTGLDKLEFPYLTIEVIDDDATRKHHLALQGYTRRIDDPVWQWLKPPFEYNCRCTVRAVHMSEEIEESLWMPSQNDYEFTRGR